MSVQRQRIELAHAIFTAAMDQLRRRQDEALAAFSHRLAAGKVAKIYEELAYDSNGSGRGRES